MKKVDTRRKTINQSRRGASAKGVYPPAGHTHREINNNLSIIGTLTVNNNPIVSFCANDIVVHENAVVCYEGNVVEI